MPLYETLKELMLEYSIDHYRSRLREERAKGGANIKAIEFLKTTLFNLIKK